MNATHSKRMLIIKLQRMFANLGIKAVLTPIIIASHWPFFAPFLERAFARQAYAPEVIKQGAPSGLPKAA